MKGIINAIKNAMRAETVYEFAKHRNLFLPAQQAIYRLHGARPTNGLERRSHEFPFTMRQLADYVAYNATHGTSPLVYGSCQSIEDLENGFLDGRELQTNNQHGLLIGVPKDKLYIPGPLGIEVQMCADEDTQRALGDKISREKEVIFGEMTTEQALVYVVDLSALKAGEPVANLMHEVNPKLPKYVTLDEVNSQEYLQEVFDYSTKNQSVHHVFFEAGTPEKASKKSDFDKSA
ncbi:hypothetical protein L3V82_07155 [Thiotrichales bacterium 19S3-7]|nr:hypothetical protein [Thiotrichales bacterium 19S3-7]MCF6801936.1 hypothetical protein [Thiotrichales bacterium 19S3-11]